MKKLYGLCVLCGFFAFAALGLAAQSNPTGSLTGVVTDPSGAAIPGASLVITDNATHHVFNLETDVTGRYALANLSPDIYTVVASHQGFQSGRYNAVAIQVGQVYTLNPKLKVGEATQTVEVQAGQQVLETQSTTISSQITGSQVTSLPISSRNAQDLAIIEPSMQTTTTPRSSQFDGLPPGAVNLTFDGINSQDQVLKASSGSSFFSTNQPRLDDVQEMSISTSSQDASSNGEGAVQVAFVSKKGTNQFHGGGWEYLRNNDLNSNYYFNKETRLPRQRIDLNEFGYKIGGPILHNKLFFFTDLDQWENPQAQSRSRNILTTAAAQGKFTYAPGTMPSSATPNAWTTCSAAASTCTADLMAMANQNGGFTSAVDPIEATVMSEVAGAATAPGVTIGTAQDFNTENLNWNALAGSHRRYPDIRLDYNINQTNSLEYDYHYAFYNDSPDVLNRADATYPIAPFTSNVGAQISNRNLMALAWRSQLSPTMNNELRVGGQSAPLWFFSGQTTAIYPTIKTDVGTLFMQPDAPNLMSTNPYAGFGLQGRNGGNEQLNETLSWLHGNHAMSIGGTFTNVYLKDFFDDAQVASVNLGMNPDDPADAIFNSTNLPGITSTDLGTAQNLYGVLAGHVTGFSDTINANPYAGSFQAGYDGIDHVTQHEYTLFFSDSWHARPNLTVNYGLRWEFEQTPQDDLNLYSVPVGAGAGAYGVSGLGNLFQPGNMPASVTSFVNDRGQNFYNSDKKDFAPSLGLAWTPGAKGGLLGKLLGTGGQSVIRAGYSIAYDREGLNGFLTMAETNPGTNNNVFESESTAATAAANPGQGFFPAGTITLGTSPNIANGLSAYDRGASFTFGSPFGINSIAGDQVGSFVPGIAQPLIESWSLGFQRQLNQNTALEIDYVGNHGMREWGASGSGGNEYINLNETNIFENGFLSEFNNAAHNLSICQANPADCAAAQTAAHVGKSTPNSFADWGLAGQTATPIFSGSFTGSAANNPSAASSLFSNGTFVTDLQTGQAGAVANSMANNYTDWQNLTGPGGAGYPDNFWQANPDATGGAYVMTDWNQSTYNGLQVTLRRRMAQGLQFDANYTWAHSLGTGTVLTLRNYGDYKAPSPEDLRQAFKVESLYELPFGAGHRWKSGSGLVNALIGGWGWDTINRLQTGNRIAITSSSASTVNGSSGGVMVLGTDVQSIQDQLAVSKQTNSAGTAGSVYYAPNGLLGTGQQKSNTSILAPCDTPGSFCQQPFLIGPGFFKSDWGLVKDTQLTEGMKLTLRANALDVFNNVNFQAPSGNAANITQSTFMRITSGYQDFTSTQDPGGRVIEFQARITF
ncbi:MAG: carboxypeptidase-like regulatory domain-containing protein [Terriglobales bacterium]